MADSLPLSMAESVLGKLGSLALEEFFLAWGLETDLEKIKRNLKVIEAVLLDAEQQLSLNPRIKIWLDNLKQVLYDAEDVVDEFECEALRSKVVKSGKTTRKVIRRGLPL
ncbi:putative disease resistance protein At1g50180 isoform X1 [Manihot esculenta]|uniref:putative disease resistance protein At1g50180 isoform X1 n=1 Tax=Manihot esculenta TaxID=3983 RepID=UPI000B5D60CD|nr:putative disease resistance protein At1g50180 isoform X1 [Manihot esculenta]